MKNQRFWFNVIFVIVMIIGIFAFLTGISFFQLSTLLGLLVLSICLYTKDSTKL
ncbi:hypothetical protein BBOR36S_02405 [Brevibacillus borstelensis]